MGATRKQVEGLISELVHMSQSSYLTWENVCSVNTTILALKIRCWKCRVGQDVATRMGSQDEFISSILLPSLTTPQAYP